MFDCQRLYFDFLAKYRFKQKGGKLGNEGGNIIEVTSWKDYLILFGDSYSKIEGITES